MARLTRICAATAGFAPCRTFIRYSLDTGARFGVSAIAPARGLLGVSMAARVRQSLPFAAARDWPRLGSDHGRLLTRLCGHVECSEQVQERSLSQFVQD